LLKAASDQSILDKLKGCYISRDRQLSDLLKVVEKKGDKVIEFLFVFNSLT